MFSDDFAGNFISMLIYTMVSFIKAETHYSSAAVGEMGVN